MKLEYLDGKKQFISVAFLGVSALFAVLILVELKDYFVAAAEAENTVKTAVSQSRHDPNELKKHLAASKAIADKMKKKNLFIPPAPKVHPIKQVQGIWGNEALINGKWYKAGDRIADANIVAIDPTGVRTMWEGQEKTFRPIDLKVASSSSGSRSGRPAPESDKPEEKGPSGTVQVQIQQGSGMGRFDGMSREDIMARMRGMRERFENMSPEERERFRSEMRERFGGRGPGGGPGGRFGGGRRGGR